MVEFESLGEVEWSAWTNERQINHALKFFQMKKEGDEKHNVTLPVLSFWF